MLNTHLVAVVMIPPIWAKFMVGMSGIAFSSGLAACENVTPNVTDAVIAIWNPGMFLAISSGLLRASAIVAARSFADGKRTMRVLVPTKRMNCCAPLDRPSAPPNCLMRSMATTSA